MYRFRKKFKRPKTFFYTSDNRRRKMQSSDLVANISTADQSYEQESVSCNVDVNADCVQDGDYIDQSQEFDLDLSFTDDCQFRMDVDEELKQPLHLSQKNISPVCHYAWLLMQFGYVTNVFEQQSFAVLNYNVDKRAVVHTSYVFVHRYPHQISDGYGWVFGCSCDVSRMEFVEALNERIDCGLDEAVPYPSCLHISAMEMYLDVYDKKFGIDAKDLFLQSKNENSKTHTCEHSYNLVQMQEDLFSEVCGGIQWIAVKPVTAQWGVCTFVYSKVNPPRPELKCCSCSSYHCIHVATIAKSLEDVTEEEDSSLSLFKIALETSPEMRDYFEMATHSEEKVPLFATGNENDANDYASLPQKNGTKIFIPNPSGLCSCGAEWYQRTVQDEWLDVESCLVAYLYTMQNVNVYFRPCSSCPNKRRYDGIENKVVWFGSFCISHAVLKDYIRLFITASLPMYKYYVAYVQRQVSSGNFTFSQEITYTKFRLAVIAMIRLLDINFEDGFFCVTCGKIPNKLVMDGTTLGIQKTYLPNIMIQSDTGLLDGSRFEMRNFINRKSVRELLKKFCNAQTSLDEFKELITEVPSPGLRMLLESLEEQGLTNTCPESCRRLLLALASDKPVCAIVPPSEEVWDLLTRISDGLNPQDHPSTDLKLLHEQVPVLFNIVKTCNEIPQSVRLIVKELIFKSANPFLDQSGEERLPHDLPPTENDVSNGYLPCLPERIQRGNYVLDSKKIHKGDCAKVPVRQTKKHGTLIPGIFCVLCPHGICYGFQIMRDHESPDVPFTVLRTRFPKAPELVIYDNSCRLHEYCLNRDPGFFKNTKFVVDKFHWKNHSGCSEGYNMKLYPTLAIHNSQVAEQCNSSIKPLASMVSYMEYGNFILFSKLFIWYRNMLRIVKSNPENDIQYKDYFLSISNALYQA